MNNRIIKKENVNSIAIYKNNIEVIIKEDTVWLTQKQMSVLFGKNVPTINEHINNIFKEKELKKNSVIRKFRITASDGKTYKTNLYNLDVIISVGYRVKSKNGTNFRIWATRVLKKHLLEGYTLNKKRLEITESKYKQIVDYIKTINKISLEIGVNDSVKNITSLINQYSEGLELLQSYDYKIISKPRGTLKGKFVLTYEEAKKIILKLKKIYSAGDLFGKEKDNSFKSSISAIYQTFDGKELYPSVEEKASNLLYFIVKNHSFIDGNKRIAAFIFVYFLSQNGILNRNNKTLTNGELAAITLMTALSDRKDKENIIKVIMNILK